MPRKLNKIPSEVMPSEGSRGINENPANEPSPRISELKKAHERASKAEQTRAKGAEAALRSQAENEDLVSVEALSKVRSTLRSEDIAAASKDDKILEYAAAKNKQEAILKKAEAAGLTSAQFYQMLENGPLDDQPERFGKVKNFFRRLAGQAWAGKDTAQLNKLMSEYLAAETIVNAPAQKDLENIQAAPRSRPSIGGSRIITREGGEKAEQATTKEDTIDAARSFDVSNEEMLASNVALNTAYTELAKTDKKAAKALVESIGIQRYNKFGSTEYTEERSVGKAKGSKGRILGAGGNTVTQSGSGATGANPEISTILNKLDEKLARAEFAAEKNNPQTEPALKEKPVKGDLTAEQMREFDEANARMNGGIVTKPGTVDRVTNEYANELDSTLKDIEQNKQLNKDQEQINREVRWLAAFSKKDAEKAFKLMMPNTPAARLKEVTGNKLADEYRSAMDTLAKVETGYPNASKDVLNAIKARIEAVSNFAATVTVELSEDDMMDVETINPQKQVVSKPVAEVTAPRAATPPPVPFEAMVRAAEKQKNKAKEEEIPFFSDADVELIEDEPLVKASEQDIAAFARTMNKRSGKEKKSNKKPLKKSA